MADFELDPSQRYNDDHLSPTSLLVPSYKKLTQDSHLNPFSTSLQSPDQEIPKQTSTPSAWDLYSAVQELYTSTSNISQVPPVFPPNVDFKPPPHCTQCGTVQSRRWRRNQSGQVICETCGIDTHIENRRGQVMNVPLFGFIDVGSVSDLLEEEIYEDGGS